MNKMTRHIIAYLLAAFALTAYAVPAKKGVLTFTQPDGTNVEVTLHGDESFHYYLTADGFPLMADSEGTLRFAKMENGAMTPSVFKACDPSERTAALTKWLADAPHAKEFADNLRQAAIRANAPKRVIPQQGIGLSTTSFPRTGKIKGLVILVQYSNVKFKIEDPKTYFTNLLNQQGFSDYKGTGSAREYFLDASNGKFDADFDVYGPVTLPYKRSYYGATTAYSHDSHPEDMAVHAVEILKDEVDFSQYDNDKDGILDNIFIFYAGQGQNDGGPAECIWPHAWELTATGKQFMVDGVLVSRYACSNEWQTQAGLPDGIGTFCHEFSHVMGLPDLYSTNGDGGEWTPGAWSVMDYGPYSNDSRTPPTYSAYERNAMGWLDVQPITEAYTAALPELQESNKGFLIATRNPNEFFLFENRQQTKWDTYLPGHGMLIWHVDFDQNVWDKNQVNNNRQHQYVDLIEANGAGNKAEGRSWPGTTKKTRFTGDTSPAFVDWYGQPMALPITNIEETDGVITFDVDGGDFVFDLPGMPVASEETPVSFHLTWPEVDRAKTYELSVYTKSAEGEHVYVEDLKDCNVGEEPAFTVEGLSAETDYYAVVRAVNGMRRSEPSPELHVKTPELSFPYYTPDVLPATDITGTSFTANWRPVDEAVSYLLTVATSFEVEPHTNTCSFGSAMFMLPKGWEFSENTSRYEDGEFCGKAIPSAKMSKDGSYITTKSYDYDVQGIKFWYKGDRTNTQCSFDVEGLADGKWIPLHSIASLSREATDVEVKDIPRGVRQVRFTYHRYGNGFLAIDDIEIMVGGEAQKLVEGYDGLDVGNVTSLKIGSLPSGEKGFVYKVQAVDAQGRKSLVSHPQKVDLDLTGITSITSENTRTVSVSGNVLTCKGKATEKVSVWTPDGRPTACTTLDADGHGQINLPSNGIYIVRFADKAFKVLTR